MGPPSTDKSGAFFYRSVTSMTDEFLLAEKRSFGAVRNPGLLACKNDH